MPCGATSLHPTDPTGSGGTPPARELPWHQEGRGRRMWLMEWPGPPEKAEEPGPAAPSLSPGAQRDSRPRSAPPPASQPYRGQGLNTPRESLGCYLGGSELGLFKSVAKVLLNNPPEAGLVCSAPIQTSAGSPGVGTGRGRGGWKQEQAAGVAPLWDAPPWRPAGELLVALIKEFESSRKALDPTLGISWHGSGPDTCGAAPL